MLLSYIILFAILLNCVLSLFISVCIYFLPIIIAYVRKHKNITSISILTIFLGWTCIGWFAAVLWSLNSDTKCEEDDD